MEGTEPIRMRKVVEHVVLFKMQDGFEDSPSEKDMLDHLYTLQYHYRNILAVSLGRIYSKRSQGYTHALIMRFPDQRALEDYAVHPSHSRVLAQFVMPYCEDVVAVDYEADVEEDIEAIFRRGEMFESGIEHVVLLKVKEGATGEQRTALVNALSRLPEQIGSHVVQLTAGANFSGRSKGYTNGAVIRVLSEEDLEAFNKHPSHREVLRKHILPITEGLLSVDFRIDPIGKRVM